MLEILGPLFDAVFIERETRFTALVEIEGGRVRAHLPTSSRMQELLLPGTSVVLAGRDRIGRSTRYDLIMVRNTAGLISVDSRAPSRLMELTFKRATLKEFEGWAFDRREVRLGDSRLDFLLAGPEGKCWVETKSVTLVRNGTALFPDAPTVRGSRHMEELAHAVKNGNRAAAVFVVQRADAERFAPNRDMDPMFAQQLERAIERGVEVYAYRCAVSPDRISIDRRIEVCI